MESLLAQFKLQTKVIVFFVPLVSIICAVGLVSYFASFSLQARIEMSNSVLNALTGFKDIHSGMTSFLQDTTEANKTVVIEQLADQEASLKSLRGATSTNADRAELNDVSADIAKMRTDVDDLWSNHVDDQGLRATIDAELAVLSSVQADLAKQSASLSKESRKLQKPVDALVADLVKAAGSPSASQIAKRISEAAPNAAKATKLAEGVTASSRKLIESLYLVRVSTAQFLGAANDENRTALLESFDQAQNDMQVLRGVARGFQAFEDISTRLLSGVNTMETNTKSLISVTKQRLALYRAAGGRIDQSWSKLRAFAETQKAEARQQSDMSNAMTIIAITIGIATAALAGLGLVLTLKRPIASITTAMLDLARGNVDAEIPGSARRDEVGDMARAMSVFKENAISRITAEEDATSQRMLADKQRRENDLHKEETDSQIDAAVQALGAALEQLASGNLNATIAFPLFGKLEALRESFNVSIAKLSDTMRVVSSNGRLMQDNSSQLAAASHELARRTEMQAASLEETSAAVSHISSTVHDTASLATSADALVVRTAEQTEASSSIVRETVEAMRRIEHASSQIHSIIDLIDDISFQTNLLALNAGIEAARAGEAGKGFSVVAQEVRELSQKSAEAASQIKSLIGRSTNEVRQGAEMVERTNAVLGDIRTQFMEISKNVRNIALASRAQSDGLKEITAAIASMDAVTQQNAAMVEETTAASRQLEVSAGALMTSMAQFEIAELKVMSNRQAA